MDGSAVRRHTGHRTGFFVYLAVFDAAVVIVRPDHSPFRSVCVAVVSIDEEWNVR
jgi:hypothetical protein